MAASEAAVTAVMEMLGCGRYRREFSHPEPFVYDYCVQHSAEGEQSWTDRGCPVAVAAADAAVDADRASIQAETLREAATDARRVADESEAAYQDFLRPYDQGVADAWDAAADGLRARADRIEGQP